MRCASCGSKSVTQNNKANGIKYNVGKGLAGNMLLGSSGNLMGFENKYEIEFVCLQCGKKLPKSMNELDEKFIDKYLKNPELYTELLKEYKNKYPNIEWSENNNFDCTSINELNDDEIEKILISLDETIKKNCGISRKLLRKTCKDTKNLNSECFNNVLKLGEEKKLFKCILNDPYIGVECFPYEYYLSKKNTSNNRRKDFHISKNYIEKFYYEINKLIVNNNNSINLEIKKINHNIILLQNNINNLKFSLIGHNKKKKDEYIKELENNKNRRNILLNSITNELSKNFVSLYLSYINNDEISKNPKYTPRLFPRSKYINEFKNNKEKYNGLDITKIYYNLMVLLQRNDFKVDSELSMINSIDLFFTMEHNIFLFEENNNKLLFNILTKEDLKKIDEKSLCDFADKILPSVYNYLKISNKSLSTFDILDYYKIQIISDNTLSNRNKLDKAINHYGNKYKIELDVSKSNKNYYKIKE